MSHTEEGATAAPAPRRTRWTAGVLVFVVFALGVVVGGFGNHLWGRRVWGGRHLAPVPRGGPVAQLSSWLKLTPDQRKQVNAIIDDTHAQLRALYAPLDSQREQIRNRGRDRIRAILTPDQRQKFDSFLQKLAEQRKADEERGRMPPGSPPGPPGGH